MRRFAAGSIFKGTYLSQCYATRQTLLPSQIEALTQDIEVWRERLSDLSWFMKVVNESIARRANCEDKCTGHFWESRFKGQALLDDRALLACMAYADLNPIRAAKADAPENSAHTSAKLRIDCLTQNEPTPNTLEEFVASQPEVVGLPFHLLEYLELLDWTGRIIRDDKRGSINSPMPPIIERLALNSNAWKTLTTKFEHRFKQWVGSEHRVRQIYSDKHYQRIPSTTHHRSLIG